jgi:hypothetical protein
VSGSYRVRTATRAELDLAAEWAAEEGWNPGLHEADCFWRVDPEGFFTGLLDDEPVAFLAGVRYNKAYGFLGFYLVRSGLRGRGYGIQVWNAAMAHLGGRAAGLDGVPEQQDNYRRSGFEYAYRNVRYAGAGVAARDLPQGVVRASEIPPDELSAYDARLFGLDRRRFLECWVRQPGSLALAKHGRDGLEGYGAIRPCRDGFKVGPLFAASPDVAATLLDALRAHAGPESPVFLDVPELNAPAVALAEGLGMSPIFETARMYRGAAPAIPVEQVFGVTSFELG